jgi:NADP-dependent 3-hydroxy acid dehydrogenase YdfG
MIADLAERSPSNAMCLLLDVNNTNEIETAVRLSVEAFGRIDTLVNNAGYGYQSTVEEGDRRIRPVRLRD